MDNEFIKMENVTKVIKRNKVLDNVSISLKRNNIYGIQGINGAGKTMLLRAIAGLIRTKGEITVGGIKVGDGRYPRDIGILIENPGFLKEFSGRENLKILSFIQDNIGDSEIDGVLTDVGLDPEDGKKYGKYSLGMKERLGIAQAILGRPELILLDEPTNALDVEGIKLLGNLIRELKAKGSTIIIASHDKGFLEGLTDEIIVMERGALI